MKEHHIKDIFDCGKLSPARATDTARDDDELTDITCLLYCLNGFVLRWRMS